MTSVVEKKTSRIARASIFCALLAIFMIFLSILFTFCRARSLSGYLTALSALFSITAFLLGIIAIVVIGFRRHELKGWGYAVASIVLALPITFFMGCSILVALLRAEREKINVGTYNLRLLGNEIIKYSETNGGSLPAADTWCDLLMEHNENLKKANFKHPRSQELNLNGECQFAFNKNLSGKRLSDMPGDVVLLFEADGDWNLNGTEKLLKTRYKEHGYVTILFADRSTGSYWFYKNAVRKFDSKGTRMYYEKPRWSP